MQLVQTHAQRWNCLCIKHLARLQTVQFTKEQKHDGIIIINEAQSGERREGSREQGANKWIRQQRKENREYFTEQRK
jgi:hypothetical protein